MKPAKPLDPDAIGNPAQLRDGTYRPFLVLANGRVVDGYFSYAAALANIPYLRTHSGLAGASFAVREIATGRVTDVPAEGTSKRRKAVGQ